MYSHHSKNGTNTADVPKRDVGDCLLEIDNWKLIKARFPPLTGVDSYPVHYCGKSPEGYGVHRDNGSNNPGISIHDQNQAGRQITGNCIKCGEHMPSDIEGLWTLHNWAAATA